MLEDFGNCVGINGQKVPAWNIQVENVPGFLTHNDGTEAWYGIYFEVTFEEGYLWVVEKRTAESKIQVEVYQDWAWRAEGRQSPEADLTIPINHWDEFLEMYNARNDYRSGCVVLAAWSQAILSRM
jgi:hypothetical protein